jgi:hypothetical protein
MFNDFENRFPRIPQPAPCILHVYVYACARTWSEPLCPVRIAGRLSNWFTSHRTISSDLSFRKDIRGYTHARESVNFILEISRAPSLARATSRTASVWNRAGKA